MILSLIFIGAVGLFVAYFGEYIGCTPTYPRRIDKSTTETGPGQYTMSCRLIESTWAPPGYRAYVWTNGQPTKWEKIEENT